jgi:hypothetical protein
MRKLMLAGAALLASCAGAAAQVVIETHPADVYVATPSYEQETYVYRTTPRVYGYTRYYRDDDDGVVVLRRGHRDACGDGSYWNGDRCIYIRY